MSLDQEENTEQIVIVLKDSKLSINKNLFVNNVLLNMGNSDGYTHKIDMCVSDFLHILNHLIGKPVQNKKDFFDTCQYLGEIELPIVLSKNSQLIQKWALSPRTLVQCEVENFVLSIYTKMDVGMTYKDAHAETLEHYKSDSMNHKLNEKSGGRIIKKLNELAIESLLFALTDDLLSSHTVNDFSYPALSSQNKWWRPLIPNTYSISNGLKKLEKKFKNFPFHSNVGNGYCVCAGGGVLRMIVKEEVTAYYNSDDDIFLITRSEEEARTMIREIHRWVCELAPNFIITRTKNAVTFTTTKGIFQVITRLYHDVLQLLSGFDLAPCCLAYDGDTILTIDRGLDCIKTNKFNLLSWKQSETMAWRCRKMRLRRFEIAIPGLTQEEFDKELSIKHFKKTLLKRILHGEGARGSDYDEIPFHCDSIDYMIDKIRSGIRYGYAKQVQVLTIDIEAVFDTNKVRHDDDFTIVSGTEKYLTFTTYMAHKQTTGSFNPTAEEFFEGIKW